MKQLKTKQLYIGQLRAGKTTMNALKLAKTHFKYELGIKWYFLTKNKKEILFKQYWEMLIGA